MSVLKYNKPSEVLFQQNNHIKLIHGQFKFRFEIVTGIVAVTTK